MLVIRLTRIGKTNEPAYRIVVAEKRNAVKGSHMEVVGFYNPSENKKLEVKKDRIAYWISKGATPSDTIASMMKREGMEGMEKFIGNRNKKRKPTKAPVEVAAAPAPKAPAKEEAPEAPAAEEAAPAVEEVSAPEAPAEEVAAQ